MRRAWPALVWAWALCLPAWSFADQVTPSPRVVNHAAGRAGASTGSATIRGLQATQLSLARESQPESEDR